VKVILTFSPSLTAEGLRENPVSAARGVEASKNRIIGLRRAFIVISTRSRSDRAVGNGPAQENRPEAGGFASTRGFPSTVAPTTVVGCFDESTTIPAIDKHLLESPAGASGDGGLRARLVLLRLESCNA
jgi:hypothetical protein